MRQSSDRDDWQPILFSHVIKKLENLNIIYVYELVTVIIDPLCLLLLRFKRMFHVYTREDNGVAKRGGNLG